MGVLDRAAQRQAHGEAFALATVVRTVSVTAAKAGAKALIAPDGSIEEGWIGGGCARAAVLKAARQCMLDGQSRLVSIAPKEVLADSGSRRAKNERACSSPRIRAPARARWTFSSSRCCRSRSC